MVNTSRSCDERCRHGFDAVHGAIVDAVDAVDAVDRATDSAVDNVGAAVLGQGSHPRGRH
ncbi:hypothetical protein CD790_20725 [Streptomyces sp. SAJ15]|nr:hypothetical protein CD790_20725 [Streptomyces sp. SAJ15]